MSGNVPIHYPRQVHLFHHFQQQDKIVNLFCRYTQFVVHASSMTAISSFAHSITRMKSYEFWGNAYDRFVNDALEAVHQHPDGMVIRTDLASYYTRIPQPRLKESLAWEMRIDSERVRWLLDRLLNKELHPEYHKQGFGLAQGS